MITLLISARSFDKFDIFLIDKIPIKMSFLVKRLNQGVKMPTKAHPDDAGWDLYANNNEEIHIEYGQRVLIGTGCSFGIPGGYYGRIADRSGCAWKHGIHVLGGVIDSTYRGEVKVILANLGMEEGFVVRKGDKIAQIILTKIHEGDMMEVDDLDDTPRGKKGFGSTGK